MLRKIISNLTYKPVASFLVVWFVMLQFPLGIFVSDQAGYVPGILPGEQPFICMGGSCGCRSAEQCWTKCCCTTPSQRIAWAKKHGYAIPEYAMSAMKEEKSPVKKSCCANHAVSVLSTKSCCDKKNIESEISTDEEESPQVKSKKSKFICWSQVEKCQGKTSSWTLLGNVIVLPINKVIADTERSFGTLKLEDESYREVHGDVNFPPPKGNFVA